MGARQKMLELVKASGWTLDPAETVNRSRYDRTRVPNPYAFFKPAVRGGTWHINLDYVNRANAWNTSIDDTLRMVVVSYYNADGELDPNPSWGKGNIGVLKRPSTAYNDYNDLYEALGDGTLSKRAARLVRDPDLAVWLAKETEYARKTVEARLDAERAKQERAAAQPLEITVGNGEHGYNSEYAKLTDVLNRANDRIKKADGRSDLPKLLYDARVALDAIVDVLTDEASLEYAANLGEF